ncbi:MAG: UDP-3-O-(3-hydroxymyristoyl)glucosamine N-acyltransferase [Chryseobacterium sp.]|nr:MAG: UDP-3-O-(3-hydroxymyristoyl)glucosamine N-acyltransferase [Chryseobacterium sp.]
MEFTAEQISGFVGGRVVGDGSVSVSGFSPIEEGKKGNLSFIANEKFAHLLNSTEASVIIVSEKLLEDKKYPSTLIVVEDGYLAFQVLLNMVQQLKSRRTGVEQPSFVNPSVEVPEEAYIGAFSYVDEGTVLGTNVQIFPQAFIGKDVKIGDNCIIHSGVKIYDGCIIGNNCVIHANTVIGADGFGFQAGPDGFTKIPQLGNVVVQDDVEIGSNCSIDRATIGSTVIGRGTKIDNLIQIAHNVKIGQHNVIAAQAGIAGSATIGDWNMIGGQTGIVGHINIGNKVRIQAQSGLIGNAEDGETLYGSPAMPAGDFRRSYVLFRQLPQLAQRVNELEKQSSKNPS